MIEYNPAYGGLWNYYRDLFGEWPNNGREESSYTKEEQRLIKLLVKHGRHSWYVYAFYGVGRPRKENMSSEELRLADAGVCAMRQDDLAEQIQAAYDDLPSLVKQLQIGRWSTNGISRDSVYTWTNAMTARIKYLEAENSKLKAEKQALEDDLK